jgi:hypothetical protein
MKDNKDFSMDIETSSLVVNMISKKMITKTKTMKIGLMGVCSNYNKHKNNQVYKISKPK